MKKIMFVFIAIASLFASCANPIMPVDTTDDRLVTGSPWNHVSVDDDGTYTYIFYDDNTFNYKFISNSDSGWNQDDSGFWETKDNSQISINGIWFSYTINENSFNFNSITYTN